MNSKERVQNAVRHLPSDRVPTLYGDVNWISLPNTRTNRPEGGFLDEWGAINIPCDGMCHGERMHPVTTIAGLVAHPFPAPLRPERWDGVLERIAAARDSWTMVILGPAIWEQIHHSCGHILEIMPDLAATGLDILQMQQPDCMGLDKILAACRGRLTLSIMP